MFRRTRFPLRALAFAAVLIAAVQAMQFMGIGAQSARGEPSASEAPPARTAAARNIRVRDGDTLYDAAANVTYRVVNIDTPEAGQLAQCAAERRLAARATRETRLRVNSAQRLELQPTGRTDRYGRTIAFVLIDGRDLGETLIAEGLARPWRGRREPWCDARGRLIP